MGYNFDHFTEPPETPRRGQWILRRVKRSKELLWVNPDTGESVATGSYYVNPDTGKLGVKGAVRVKGGWWLNLSTGKCSRRSTGKKPVKRQRPRTR